MTLIGWIIFLGVAGLLLLVAELILPAHGLLGALGVLCFLAAVGICFRLNQWFALALFLALVAATPVAWSAAVRIWPRTPVGRHIVLQPVEINRDPLPFRIGQTGYSLSELKPMGECDFDAFGVQPTQTGKSSMRIGVHSRRRQSGGRQCRWPARHRS